MKYFFRTQRCAYLLRSTRRGLKIMLNIKKNKISNNQNYLNETPIIGEPIFPNLDFSDLLKGPKC